MPALIFLILIAFTILFISSPFFKKLDELPSNSPQRLSSIDGLRGLLAFAVIVNHFDATQNMLTTNRWDSSSKFYSMLGYTGVALFFMITGYLFWSKLLVSHGKINWVKLYINRFFRIAPVYFLGFIIAFLIAIFSTHFKLVVSTPQFIVSLLEWCTVGLHNLPDINGVNMHPLLSTVWTLRYEWIFYFSLIITSVFVKKNLALSFSILGFVISLIYLQFWHPGRLTWPTFFAGMICATIKHNGWKIPDRPFLHSAIAILSLFIVFVFVNNSTGAISVLLMSVFFFFIVNGCQLIGLLALKGVKRLSHISYSLYLLHLIILYIFFRNSSIMTLAKQSYITFWMLTPICIIVVVTISSFSYYFIEKSGIEFGKRFTNKYFPDKTLKF